MPNPLAASVKAGSTPRIPTTVLAMMGSTLYRTKARKAGMNPMSPSSRNTINPSNAKLGTVCTIPAMPKAASANLGRRLAAIPNGKLISKPIAYAVTDNKMWPPRYAGRLTINSLKSSLMRSASDMAFCQYFDLFGLTFRRSHQRRHILVARIRQ